MVSGPVELSFNDGDLLSIDCKEAENTCNITGHRMADPDWLLQNAPTEYAQLVLSGEMEQYLSGTTLHGLED